MIGVLRGLLRTVLIVVILAHRGMNCAEECPDLESLWDMGKEQPVDRQIQLSHSDIGPYIHFVCPEEHHVVGPSMVTCLKGGVWDNIREPYCSSSSLYGIPQSDSILIGVIAGSGAIVLITITVILTHLLCIRPYKRRRIAHDDRLHRSDDDIPTTTYYVDDQSYSAISAPTCPTMNGKPLKTVSRGQPQYVTTSSSGYNHDTSVIHQFDDMSNHLVSQGFQYGVQDSSAHAPHVTGHVTTIGDENVFVNHGYTQEQNNMYASHWDRIQSLNEETLQMASLFQKGDENTRTSSSSSSGRTRNTHNSLAQPPSLDHFSTVNRTVL